MFFFNKSTVIFFSTLVLLANYKFIKKYCVISYILLRRVYNNRIKQVSHKKNDIQVEDHKNDYSDSEEELPPSPVGYNKKD